MNKNNTNDSFKSQQKVAFLSLLSELPNVAAQLCLAVFSGSLIIALDAVDSVSNFLQAGLSFSLSKKLRGDASFKYDYGMGKIEAFGGLVSALFLYLGLAAVSGASIYALFHPGAPREALLLAIFLKIINVSIDAFLLYRQMKTVKGIDGSFIESNKLLLKKNLIFDSSVLLIVVLSFLFRDVPAFAYFEPVMCLVCAGYVAVYNFRIIRDAAADLLDKTLDEKTQLKILKCVSTIWNDVEEFKGVRTRRSGHIVYIDLMVSFKGGSCYSEIYKSYETFDSAVKEFLPGSVTAVVIGKN
jgi:divalent metal cation (Fe/Co/Zn/Cd) transporter